MIVKPSKPFVDTLAASFNEWLTSLFLSPSEQVQRHNGKVVDNVQKDYQLEYLRDAMQSIASMEGGENALQGFITCLDNVTKLGLQGKHEMHLYNMKVIADFDCNGALEGIVYSG